MASRVSRQDVQTLYRDGVEAVAQVSSTITDDGWSALACGNWTATDTARHLCSVADWYHTWLDRALDGETSLPFQAEEMDTKTAEALSMYQHLDGPSAVLDFTESATTYLGRLSGNWDLRYAYPGGEVTAGLHAGVAAVEWHCHAWDLARVTSRDFYPKEPDKLLMAAALCMSAAKRGPRGIVIRALSPLVARHDPWKTVLRKAGRGD
jgi:hypothetical protein